MSATTVPLPNAVRRPTASMQPTRKPPALRNRGRVVAGVLLLAASALAAVLVYGNLGQRRSVLVVAHAVQAGAVIERADLKAARVATDADVQTIAADSSDRVVGRRAAVSLVPGSLLVSGAVAEGPTVPVGLAVTGAVLKAGQYPTGLRAGEAVLVVLIPEVTADGTTGGPVPATVVSVEEQRDGGIVVSLAVSPSAAPDLAVAGAQGRVTLVAASR